MRVARWPWVVIGVVSILLVLTDLVGYHVVLGEDAAGGLTPLGGIVFAVVGMLLVAKGHRNPVGRLLVAMGLVWAVGGVAYVYLLATDEYPLPLVELVTWLNLWVFWPNLTLGGVAIALFPTGRPSRRSTLWLLWLLVGIGVLGLMARMILPVDPHQPGLFGEELQVNPWAGDSLAPLVPLTSVLDLAYIGLFAAVVIDLVIRWRRSLGVERLQIRWLAFGLVVFVLLLVTANLLQAAGVTGAALGLVWEAVWLVGLGALPVTIGLAVARYRLYDIDRLISRTVTYALVAGLLAGVFAVVAMGLPRIIGIPDENPVLVAGATLAAAALFNPLRLRVQRVVDRRFNRARYDARQEVEHFSERLRAELELDDIAEEMLEVVDKTMQPVSTSVWIREDR